MHRILILGGTAEARQLADRLAARTDIAVTVSLAGRTAAPARHAAPVRTGGFGGAEGLAAYLREQHIDLLIDATHPYAARMSANAARAAALVSVQLLGLRRPPWARVVGDRWTEVDDMPDAVRALGDAPRRVFVTMGRNELAPLCAAPQHNYLIRSVDPVDPPLAVPHATYVIGRGPFNDDAERALMAAHGIEVVVAKNSGGTATYGKIAAARDLEIAVLLLRRPTLPAVPSAETVADALRFVDHALTTSTDRGV